jgi:hypothetical protein
MKILSFFVILCQIFKSIVSSLIFCKRKIIIHEIEKAFWWFCYKILKLIWVFRDFESSGFWVFGILFFQDFFTMPFWISMPIFKSKTFLLKKVPYFRDFEFSIFWIFEVLLQCCINKVKRKMFLDRCKM